MLLDPQLAGKSIKWQFLGHDTAQDLSLSSTAHHILMAGGRGWGKTETQLVRFRRHVGAGYGTYWRGIILDREYKNLDDLITKSKRLFFGAGDGAKFLSGNSDLKWVWPTGEELLFRHAKKKDDYWAYHGHEYPFVGWNELTKYPDPYLYLRMMSVNRSGFDPVEHTPKLYHPDGQPVLRDDGTQKYATMDDKPLAPIPLEVVSTTNPYGPGHAWVKRRFIDPAPYGKVVTQEFNISRIDVSTGAEYIEHVVRKQVTFFGTYKENRYLSAEYIAGLMQENDENILKAWIHGDWDIVAGGAVDDVWKKTVHVIPQFKVPSNWHVDRALDWGSTTPFSIGWFCEANGEECALPDGSIFCPPRGTIIQFAEWYGNKGGYANLGTNEGVKMSVQDICDGIKRREKWLLDQGIIAELPSPGPADNQIRNVIEKNTDTIETMFKKGGIHWLASDKGKGSRHIGLQLIRDRLSAAVRREKPGLYFTENCIASIGLIPMLPRDEDDMDDVDTEAEDHSYDMVRYRVLHGNSRAAKVIQVVFGTSG